MKIAVLANLKKDIPLNTEYPPDDDYWDDLDNPKTVKKILEVLKFVGILS